VIWLIIGASGAAAHGGVPILQLAAERINPGGTLDVRGDMTIEGPVELLLVAPAEAYVWSLGTVEADFEGHFRVFLAIPTDIPQGTYRVRARMESEEAATEVVIAGLPVGGDEGQLPGQDEALAGAGAADSPLASAGAPGEVTQAAPVQSPEEPPNVILLAGVVGVAIISALLLGAIARRRSIAR
jgi:hypothetical protein